MGRKSYEAGLNSLEDDIDDLADITIDRIENGIEALRTQDRELAEELITSDDEVDQLYLDVEKRCTDLLALHQPVARDLRFVTAVFKISTDLERIADLAVNLGEYTLRSGDEKALPDVDVVSLGEYALEMVRDAVDAFREEDPEKAVQIIQKDDEMDRRCEDANNSLIDDLMQTQFEDGGEELASTVTRVLLAIRDLERVADHAVNISARTVYMVSSDRRYI